MKSKKPMSILEKYKIKNKDIKLEDYLTLLAENKVAISNLTNLIEKTSNDIDIYVKKQQDYLSTFIIV